MLILHEMHTSPIIKLYVLPTEWLHIPTQLQTADSVYICDKKLSVALYTILQIN